MRGGAAGASPPMLRPYQTQALASLRQHHADRCVVCLPTGSGKTVLAQAIADGALARGKRVLVVAHTRQIIEQTARRFQCPMYMAEHHGTGPLLVASIQTIASRGAPPHDVLIVDECHHATSASYRDLVQAAPLVVGLTATPCRLDGTGLGQAGFGRIIEPTTASELIRDGFLANPKVYLAPETPNTDALRKSRGDFTAASAAEAMSELDGSIVKHWLEHGRDRMAVGFSPTVEHAEAVSERLRAVGARAEAVSGRDGAARREDVLGRLRDRLLDVVVNCSLYGEGWDLPDLDLAILMRPTMSLTVHRQQIGRVMRPGGQPPLVMDHAGNTKRHGWVTDPVDWSLDGRARAVAQVTPGKTCPRCFAYIASGTQVCPSCEHEFGADAVAREIAENDATLVAATAPVRSPAQTYIDLLAEAWQSGYKVGWARHKYHSLYGKWPRRYALEAEHYPCIHHDYDRETGRCDRCRKRCPDPHTSSRWGVA